MITKFIPLKQLLLELQRRRECRDCGGAQHAKEERLPEEKILELWRAANGHTIRFARLLEAYLCQ